MTALEQRFLECVPSLLKRIEEEVRALAYRGSLPIIRFKEDNGSIHIEQFNNIEEYPSEFPKYKINGYSVKEDEYRRIEKIIMTHPFFRI